MRIVRLTVRGIEIARVNAEFRPENNKPVWITDEPFCPCVKRLWEAQGRGELRRVGDGK